VFSDHADYIKQETLSVQLRRNADGDGHGWSGDIDGEHVELSVVRANGAT
jgi:hypothetical protein